MGELTFITGGARSGKSSFALREGTKVPGQKIFIATAEPFDGEMRDRISLHRAERGPSWTTVESPVDIVPALEEYGQAPGAVIIDCLTLWVSNLMAGDTSDLEGAFDRLVEAAAAPRPAHVFVVSNEVGLGIVPDNALARRFRDLAGLINQQMAAAAHRVVFMVSGIPLVVKAPGGRSSGEG